MSIERTSPLSSTTPVGARETQDSPAARPVRDVATPAASASVTLSNAQTQLMQPGNGDIDSKRVEALRQAIRNGELRMDTGKIADALLADSWSLTQSDEANHEPE